MTAQPNRSSAPVWRKSSVSGAGADCVEVATWKSSVLVRDSCYPSRTVLEFTQSQWRSFVRRIGTGDPGRD